MINSIAGRARRITPLNETEMKIIRSATKLFLENGFSKTTFSMISEDSGVTRGNIAYYFHTKEDILFLLIQELMDYHEDVIEEIDGETKNVVFACAMEIATQISICESNPVAWDLYYSAYSHLGCFEYIKDWTAKKNYRFLRGLLPDLSEEDFRAKENVASHIEFSALTAPCHKGFTLDDKISLVLDSHMKIYDVAKDIREETIKKVLESDYKNLGTEIFNKFLEKFYHSIEEKQ